MVVAVVVVLMWFAGCGCGCCVAVCVVLVLWLCAVCCGCGCVLLLLLLLWLCVLCVCVEFFNQFDKKKRKNVLGVLRTQNACVSTIVPLSDWGFEWVSPEGLGIRVGFTGGIGDLVGFPQMFFFVFVLY